MQVWHGCGTARGDRRGRRGQPTGNPLSTAHRRPGDDDRRPRRDRPHAADVHGRHEVPEAGRSTRTMVVCPCTSTTPPRRRCGPRRSRRCCRSSPTIPGNPSGSHGASRAAQDRARSGARDGRRRVCGCRPHEIVFTGGGSEGDNLAVKGAAWARAGATPALDGVVTTGIEHKAVLGACVGLDARGLPRRPRRRRDRRRRRRPRRARGRARRAHRRRVGDARQQRDRRASSRSPTIAALVRERAPRAVAAHRRGAGAAVARPRAHTPRRRISSRSPVTSSAARRVSARSSSAAASRSCRSSRAAATNRAAGPAPRTSPASSRSPPRCGSRTSSRAEETARIAALRDRARSGPGRRGRRASRSTAIRTAGSPGVLHCTFPGVEAETLLVALDQHGVYGRVGFGVQLRRDRSVARAARDGHGARPRAVVGALLARLRVDAAPTSTPRSRSCPRSVAEVCGRRDGARGHGDDERRRRLVGRGRAAARAGSRRHRRHAEAVGRRERLRVLQRLRRRGRAPGRRAARHPALRLQLLRRLRRERRRRRTSAAYAARRDAEPVRRVQPHDEVRSRARTGAPTRLRLRRHRSSRARRRHRRRLARSRAVPMRPRTSRTCSTCSAPSSCGARCFPSASSPRPRCASARVRSVCARRPSPRAWTCASSRRAAARRSSARASRGSPVRSSSTDGTESRPARRHRRVHDRSAARARGRGRRTPLRHRHRAGTGDGHARHAR